MKEMEDKKQTSSKVSLIANIFQGMAPSRDCQGPEVGNGGGAVAGTGAQVSVVRTESHLARFNNARALFEKLGEENRPLHRVEKSPSGGGLAGLSGRSRSSSAGSRAGKLSRSPSPPPKPDLVPHHNHNSNVENDRNINGNVDSNTTSFRTAKADYRIIANANGTAKDVNRLVKPLILPKKPEKPERKFNSKELIEKQRNWTSHFSKARTVRAAGDSTKSEAKNVAIASREDRSSVRSPVRDEPGGIKSPFRSPPMSPPPPPSTPPRVLSPTFPEVTTTAPSPTTRTSKATSPLRREDPPYKADCVAVVGSPTKSTEYFETAPVSAPRSPRNVSSPVHIADSPTKVSSPSRQVDSPIRTVETQEAAARPVVSPTKGVGTPTKVVSSPTKGASSPTKGVSSPTHSVSSPIRSVDSPVRVVSPPIQEHGSPPVSPVKVSSPRSPVAKEVSPVQPEEFVPSEDLDENVLMNGKNITPLTTLPIIVIHSLLWSQRS